VTALGQTEGRLAERTLFGHPVGLANLFGVELPKTTATGIVGAYGGLALVALGSGALAANASLGTLYMKGDALRRWLHPLLSRHQSRRLRWSVDHRPAADSRRSTTASCRRFGMALGLAQYVAFRRNLGTHGRTVPNPLPRSAIAWVVGIAAASVAYF
jgi:proton-dependent oligopeptide transporter, POT family